MINRLILGDNVEILRGLESESVDLVYLDPPFFSDRDYEVIWGDAGEILKTEYIEKGLWEIVFVAKAVSESGIEFYSWDFEFDFGKGFRAEVVRDCAGRQTHRFNAGLHNVAVKTVDNDGLENTEVIKLKINGVVERIN